MQHPIHLNARTCGRRCAGAQFVARQPLPSATRSLCALNTWNRIAAHSSAVETASAPIVQVRDTQPPCLDFTDVNRHNFKAVLPIMREAIQEATFVAIDTEFTGLTPEGVYEEPLDDFEERYKKVLASADNFVICQFGLSAFKWQAAPAAARGGYWEAKTFNAYIFPRPDEKANWDKRFLCQASSLAYLAEQGFNFNKMIYDGIGFMPLSLRDAKVRSLREDMENIQRSRAVRGPAEEELVEGVRSRVLPWLLGAEEELLLPLPSTRRQRRLVLLVLQDEFQLPSLGYDPFAIEVVEPSDEGQEGGSSGDGGASAAELGPTASVDAEEESSEGESEGSDSEAGGSGAGGGCLRLRRLDQWRPGNLIARGQQLTPRQRIELMMEESGFTQVMDIIRGAGRPVVGHNATLDLAYTLSHFVGALPRTWRAYKALLQRCFPGGVYDTKHVATQLQAAGVPIGDTGLGALFRTLKDEQWLRANVLGAGLPISMGGGVPDVRHAAGFGGYEGVSTEKAHEAGFDAFMTGVAFSRLLRLVAAKATLQSGSGAVAAATAPTTTSTAVAADGGASDAVAAATADSDATPSTSSTESDALLQPLWPYRGRVHFLRSDLPYADMYGSDPLPSRPAVLYVGGIGPKSRPQYLQQRFTSFGFPPVVVSMVTGTGGKITGALIQLARADQMSRAIQVARKRQPSWTVQTFAEYYQNRSQQQQQQQEGEAGVSGADAGAGPGRAPPRMIRAAEWQPQSRAGEVAVGSAGGDAGSPAAASSGQRVAAAGAAASVEALEAKQDPSQARVAQQQSARQRLQAFTQAVAAAASASGTLTSRAGDKGVEGGAVAEPSGSETPSAAAVSTSDVSATDHVSSEGAADTRQPIAGDRLEDGASASGPPGPADIATGGGQGEVARTVDVSVAEDVEAARLAAERLRSLADAVQRLKSLPAKDRPAQQGPSGSGVTLQRPGRPSR